MIDLHTGKTAYPTEAQRNAKPPFDEAVARHGEVESSGEALRQESLPAHSNRAGASKSKSGTATTQTAPGGERKGRTTALEAKLPEALAAVNTRRRPAPTHRPQCRR